MNIPADTLSEQLSAFMDGELPEPEARFLLRRLEHDAQLRAEWARLHLASACIKGQPVRPMAENLCAMVSAEIAQAPPSKGRRPLLHWAMAASVAALALVFAPRLMQDQGADSATVAAGSEVPVPGYRPGSPASADLVAARPAGSAVAPDRLATAASPASASDFMKSAPEAPAKESPIPLSAQSPADFPLVEGGDKRSWPRSELIGAANDPAIEAYLVRHNQMLANDGLGGFVPYVDVVANDEPASVPGQDAGASQR